MIRRLATSVCVLFAVAGTSTAEPVFQLGFGGGNTISGTPGLTVQIPLTVQLMTTPDAMFPDDGATGWSLSIASELTTIVDATVQGTAGASIDDTPPGLRNPAFGSEETSLTSGPDNAGAVSTVVLHATNDDVQLPPSGKSNLLVLTLRGTIPAVGITETWRIFTKDGLSAPGATPVDNLIGWQNGVVVPLGAEMRVAVTGLSSQIGDTNNDGVVNLDDLNNVRNNFGTMGPSDGSLPGDAIPPDGMVDIDDLNNVRNNFGAGAGAAAAPEPAAVLLLCGGLAALTASGRRDRRR